MHDTVLTPACLVGASARTLRYYDQIGLLAPKRQDGSVYRIYGPGEVDRLLEFCSIASSEYRLATFGFFWKKLCGPRGYTQNAA